MAVVDALHKTRHFTLDRQPSLDYLRSQPNLPEHRRPHFTSPHPNKWDKTGIVVEVRQFDQYVIRVDGSGRVTLRNRRHLRKYVPFLPHPPVWAVPSPQWRRADSTRPVRALIFIDSYFWSDF